MKYKILYILCIALMFILIFSMLSGFNPISFILICFDAIWLTDLECKLNPENLLNKVGKK